jgi:hypothetical protein
MQYPWFSSAGVLDRGGIDSFIGCLTDEVYFNLKQQLMRVRDVATASSRADKLKALKMSQASRVVLASF